MGDNAQYDDLRRCSKSDVLDRALAAFHVDPEILGGTVVRVGERIHDGSVRRRMTKLRRQLLSG
jgi:F0F1-type ATP synthase delta subunit